MGCGQQRRPRRSKEDNHDITGLGRARHANSAGLRAGSAGLVRPRRQHQGPTPYFAKYGENLWAAVKGFLDAVAETAAAPVIEKYTGVLGAVDVFTVPTAFSVLESIRLDLGYRMDVHP